MWLISELRVQEFDIRSLGSNYPKCGPERGPELNLENYSDVVAVSNASLRK